MSHDPFGQFNCRVCGIDAMFSFVEPTAHEDSEHPVYHFQAWCETHCPSHSYEYDRFDRDWYCKYCGVRPEADWYIHDDW